MRRIASTVGFLLAVVLALASPGRVLGQAMDTTVHCRACVKTDSLAVPDSAPAWRYFTTWTFTFRDSLLITPKPVPPPVEHAGGPLPSDTAGMRLLAGVTPTRQNDPGFGPVKLANGGTWSGQMYFDAAEQAIRYDLRDGCWGGTSAGFAWFEVGMVAQNARTVYTSQWVKVSPNFYGHAVGMKMTILGWGTGPGGGNHQILFLRGSPRSSTGTLRVGWSWQGAGALPTAAKVGGLSGLDPVGGNFSVPGGVLQRGTWTKVETLSYTGPPGTRSSWSKIWMDGALVADVDGYDATRTLPTYALSAYKLLSVWGGGVSCTAPGGQQYYIRGVQVLGR